MPVQAAATCNVNDAGIDRGIAAMNQVSRATVVVAMDAHLTGST